MHRGGFRALLPCPGVAKSGVLVLPPRMGHLLSLPEGVAPEESVTCTGVGVGVLQALLLAGPVSWGGMTQSAEDGAAVVRVGPGPSVV